MVRVGLHAFGGQEGQWGGVVGGVGGGVLEGGGCLVGVVSVCLKQGKAKLTLMLVLMPVLDVLIVTFLGLPCR